MRLKVESSGKSKKETPAEFVGLVEYLQNVCVDYDLFVTVEGEGSRAVKPLRMEQYWDTWIQREEEDL